MVNIIDFIHRILALLFFIFAFPILAVAFVLVKIFSPGPFLFYQKRMGKNKKVFTMYKIRTMVKNAENLKEKYKHLNLADGPAFKIKDDPRYTKVGRIISYLGLDELPQLINVLKGEMALVGPRPLPVDEAIKIPKKYKERFSVLPGITSSWIIKGGHTMSFERWMRLDIKDMKNKSFYYDLKILLGSILFMIKLVLRLLHFLNK